MEAMSTATTQLFEIAGTFGIPAPQGLQAHGYAEAGPFVPEPIPNYVFRAELLRDWLAWWHLDSPDGLYLGGPAGCGKSSLLIQAAARLNIPVQRVSAHSRLEWADLIGHYTVVDGTCLFFDGPLTTAMRCGHLLILEEADTVDPAVTTGLFAVLDGAPLVVAENGGELVAPALGFRIALTGNTTGGGDPTGLYRATTRQNLAFMDRFWVILADYPKPEVEAQILQAAVPAMSPVLGPKLVEVAAEVRRLFVGADEGPREIDVTFSTRTLIRWAQIAVQFREIPGGDLMQYALERALTFRTDAATREAVHEIARSVLGTGGEPLRGAA